MKVGQDRVKKMLTDTVSLLCKNSLQYEGEISIEGLLGIKVDKKDVFFVHISENFGKDGQQALPIQEQIVISDGTPAKKKRRKQATKKQQQQVQQQQQIQHQQIQHQQMQHPQTVQLELVPKVMEEVKVEDQVAVQGQPTECTVLTAHDVKIETVQQVAEIVAGQRRVALRTAKDLQQQVQEVTLHSDTAATQAVYEAAAAGQATFVQTQPQTFDPAHTDAEGRVSASLCTPTSDPWPTTATTVACVDTISVQAAQAIFQGSTTMGGDTLQTWSLPAGVVVQTEADTITTLSQPTLQTTTLTTDVSGQQAFTLPKYKWTMLGHRSPDGSTTTTTVRLPQATTEQQQVVQQVAQHATQQQTAHVAATQQVTVAQAQQQVVQQVTEVQQQTQVIQPQQQLAPVSQATVTVTPAAPTTATAPITKNRECTICGKTFLLDSSLKRHLRAHAGKKPYKCELCEAAFIQSSDLKKHFRSHTGEKPYSCTICGMAFSQVGDRNRHQARHNRLGKA